MSPNVNNYYLYKVLQSMRWGLIFSNASGLGRRQGMRDGSKKVRRGSLKVVQVFLSRVARGMHDGTEGVAKMCGRFG